MNLKQHQAHMLHAIELAKKGSYYTKPNPNVGCVLVSHQNEIISKGWHQYYGGSHAEVEAIRESYRLGKNIDGCTAYVTLEPCSHVGKTGPCVDALIAAGVSKVFIAVEDPNPLVRGQGIKKLRLAKIDVHLGLCQKEAEIINAGFFKSHLYNKPYVRVKIAASIDGKTSMSNGESKWITDKVSRLDVQKLRAKSGAIITGIGTILADDPSLNVRYQDQSSKYELLQPLRVVLDNNLRLPLDSKIIGKDGLCYIVTQSKNEIKIQALKASGVKIIQIPTHFASVDTLEYILEYLSRNKVNDILVEAGPKLVGSFIRHKMLDELIVYTAPCLMGVSSASMTNINLETMANKVKFRLHSVDKLSDDIKCIYVPEN